MKLPPGVNPRVILFGFAGVCMVGAVLFVQRYLAEQREILRQQAEQEAAQQLAAAQPPTIEVVTAATDIPEGTTLEPSHLAIANVPETSVQPYAVRSPGEVTGKITLAPIATGEQVLSNKVRRPEDVPVGSTLSSLTPKGKRAVTIAVDTTTGVGGFVRPGDIVDILWTMKMPSAEQPDGEMVTLTVFQDVSVLAVGGELMGRTAQPAPSGDAGGTRDYTVTLALTPQETSFLLFAREQGRVQLSLRPKSEEATPVNIVPANINTLLQMQLGIATPQSGSAKPATRQVEVYKGLKRDIVALSEGE